ncbi:MAG: hypothetical protein R3D59_05320 [Paracoccaceae bacterium]
MPRLFATHFLAALLLVCGFILTADRALAQSGLSERADFAERARSAVNAGIAGILTSDCIDPNTPRPYDLTYLGLPKGDPNLSESNRRRLNEHLENAIRTSGLAINVNAAENASVVAPILARTDEGSRSIERLVNRLYASTFAIAVQALRPAPDIAHIRSRSLPARPTAPMAATAPSAWTCTCRRSTSSRTCRAVTTWSSSTAPTGWRWPRSRRS